MLIKLEHGNILTHFIASFSTLTYVANTATEYMLRERSDDCIHRFS